MNQATRELLLKVCDGNMRVPPHLFELRNHPKQFEFLRYLVAAQLTGKTFLEWLEFKYENKIERAIAAWAKCNEPRSRPIVLL
jgi:hypothetical protein